MQRALLILAFALSSGCLLEGAGGGITADGDVDAGPDAMIAMVDAMPEDGATPDGSTPEVDAGPPPPECPHRGRVRPIATVEGGALAAGVEDGAIVDAQAVTLPVDSFAYGYALFTGYEGAQLDDASPAIADIEPSTRRYAALQERIAFQGLGSPAGLGLGNDDYSILVTGELFLAEGDNRFEIDGDDRLVIEIDGPAGTVSGVSAWDIDPAPVVTVSAPSGMEGFYPFRIAFEEGAVEATLRVRRVDGTGTRSELGPSDLRVDLREVPGRAAIGWDLQVPGTTPPSGLRIWEHETNESFATTAPEGVGITSRSEYAIRWMGMLRFPAVSDPIEVTAEKRFHLFVDGVYFGDGDNVGTYAGGFGPGWHEVVLELQQDGGNDGRVALTVGDAPIALADQRAFTRAVGLVGGAGERVDSDVGTDATVESGDLDVSLWAGLPPTSFVDVSAIVRTERPGDVYVRWSGPDSVTGMASVRDAGRRVFGTADWIVQRRVDTASGVGRWRVAVVNESDRPAYFVRAGVLAHVGGASDAYPTSGTWTSAPIALGEDVAIERVGLLAEVPGGAAVRAAVRAASTEAGLASATFVDLDGRGRPTSALSGSFAEVRLTLESDGAVTPRVWRIAIDGRPCVDCGAAQCPPWESPGLLALYDFEATSGTLVSETSGVLTPALDLVVADVAAVRWADGALVFDQSTIAEGIGDADQLVERCQTSGELSVEAWVTADSRDLADTGPAPIVTLSIDESDQGFVLGQHDDGTVVGRVQTSDATHETTVSDVIVPGQLQHLVFTRRATGETVIYVDGELAAMDAVSGDLSAWSSSYRVAVGNERTQTDRTWRGALHLVAIHARALDATEVRERWEIGPDGGRVEP